MVCFTDRGRRIIVRTELLSQVLEPLMATSNSPTFGQSNSPRQDSQIISLLV